MKTMLNKTKRGVLVVVLSAMSFLWFFSPLQEKCYSASEPEISSGTAVDSSNNATTPDNDGGCNNCGCNTCCNNSDGAACDTGIEIIPVE